MVQFTLQTAFHKDSFSGLLSSSLHCPLLLRLHRSFHQYEILSAFSVQWVLSDPSLSANSQCLQEHKLYFKRECQERQKNPSLANVFLRQSMWVENKPAGPTTWILTMDICKILTPSREINGKTVTKLITIYFPHYIIGMNPCCHT